MSENASKPKVLCAMSGGVDSSVAAALLLEQGYDVVGVFMRLGSPGEDLDTLMPGDDAPACDPTRRPLKIGHQGCCSINDAADARLVAAHLGIPFYVVNFKKDFGRIIDYFVDEYAKGRTPNPCVRCNDWLKFGKLREYAAQIGANWVASGHYARVIGVGTPLAIGEDAADDRGAPLTPRHLGELTPRLARGIDRDKDQSYVLFGVPCEHLGRMMLPVGNMRKVEVRMQAKRRGLPVFNKPDSQEICFVPDNDYAGLVERRRPELAKPGAILDASGKVVGEHQGQHRFTLGQRRGVGVALGHPIYVIGKDPVANTVTVGTPERLLSGGCTVGEANWLVDVPAGGEWVACMAKYRYNSDAVPAEYRILDEGVAATHSGRRGRFEVRFATPQTAVTPGQAVVLYDAGEPDLVLGGGWIE